jgi:hypothetical protein
MKSRLIPCLTSALVVISGQALAADLKWQVYGDLGALYESNPTKVENDTQDDTAVSALIGARLYQDTQTILLDFDYRGSHQTWIDDTFDDRNTLEGYGQFTWQPADYFTFFINNRRTDLIVNNTFADTQNNRAVRSTTEAGALFTARLGRVDTLNLAPVYRAVTFSSGNGVDSNRPGMLAFWRHRLSETDALSVNVFAERVDFDSDAVQNDIDRAQAFLGYSAKLNRLSYDIEAGYTWVRGDDSDNPGTVDDSDNDYSGPLVRAYADYERDNHLFTLRAFRDLTDTSIGLDDSTVGGVNYDPGDNNVNQLALVTRTQVDLNYDLDFAAQQWNWQIGYRYDQQDVEATATNISLARDENRNWLHSTLRYEMTRNIDARLFGSYQTTDFTDSPLGREDDIYRLGLVFTFRIFKYGFINFGAEQERRNSNVDLVSDYTDNKIFANFRMEFPELPGREAGRRSVGNRYGRDYGF